MNRRSFLKLASVSGVAVMTPTLLERSAHAAGRYPGPFFILVHASGGWDPTYLCDPKGSDGPFPVNKLFKKADVVPVGPFRPAPVTYPGVNYKAADFFTKYQSRLLVINGIDTTTGNHDTGTRVIWSGQVAEGYPSFAAVAAAAKTPGNPLGFITNGGYEATGGLTSLTRLGSVDTVRRIAYANRRDPANAMSGYHSDATWERINAVQRERLDNMRNNQPLPRLNRGMNALYLARSADNDLAQLAAALPSAADINAATNDLQRQAMVAIAGFKTGLAVAANVSMGGFDTHGNHDGAHLPQMGNLLLGVDLIAQEVAKAGLTDKVVIAVGSDFGRTPAYNAGNGKDHWNITSMLCGILKNIELLSSYVGVGDCSQSELYRSPRGFGPN